MGGAGKMGAADGIVSAEAKSSSGNDASVQRVAKFILDGPDPDPTMDKRYVDQAFFSMIQDATSGETEPVWVINKRLFREGETTPLVDDIRINKKFVIRLLGNRV